MTSKILMVTASNDLTCDYLIQKFPGIEFFRFNLDQFSSYKVEVTASGFSIATEHNFVDSKTCKSIYYRKPSTENLQGILDDEYHAFAHKEAYALIEGVVESFDKKCLSKPSVMRKANNKVVQLVLAHKIGFVVPNAAIANRWPAIQLAVNSSLIVKPLSVGTVVHDGVKEYVQTNLVDDSIDKSTLKYAPVYFQEYIAKDYELRVTFVGDRAYTVRLDSRDKVDWRKIDNEVRYSIGILPDQLYEKCMSFMSALNMQFGCFDFMIKNDIYYFLEMNANGQWAWLEQELEIGISDGIMEYLND